MKFLCELMVICASLLSCPFVRAAGPLKIVKQGMLICWKWRILCWGEIYFLDLGL